MPEIMSPVGSFESLHAAIKAGADSIYFGVEHLNMRARAANSLKLKDLPKIAKIAKENKIKTYLTVNAVLYDADYELTKKIIDKAKVSNIDAIIASDMAAILYAKKINQRVHISTQVNIANLEAVKFYAQFSDVLVLARELSLAQIKEITKQIKKQKIKGPSGDLVKIEVFVHGALCVSISGKCYMSLATEGASANRGACLQTCRREYKVTDTDTGQELKIENKYIMSPKDLCTIGVLDEILDAGVEILKLEGRGKGPEYVYTVTKCYKEAVKAIKNKTYTKEKVDAWTKELENVFNRGFWHGGYYLGKKLGEWAGMYGSKAKEQKVALGTCHKYFPKLKVAEFHIEANNTLTNKDKIIITGKTTGLIEIKNPNIYYEGKSVSSAKKGQEISFKVPEKTRKGDKLYKIIPREKWQK